MARLLLWTALAATSAICALASAAEHAQVTLAFKRPEAAASCPDEATFRGLVAARLGYDPFAAAGTLALSVDFQRRGNEVVGRLLLTGKNDERRGQRTLRAGSDDCFELATSMALIAAVAVDADAVHARAEAPSVPEKPAPRRSPPAPAPPPPPAPRPPVSDRIETGVRLELSALFPVGIVPAPRGGLRTGVAVDIGLWSIGAEGSFLLKSSRENAYGEVSAYVLDGALIPCVHPAASERWLLNLCAIGTLGVLRSTAARVTRADPATDLFATIGPRAAALVMLSGALGVGASAEFPVTLSRVHLHIEDTGQRREVWAQSRVGFIGGLSLVARLE